MARTVFSKGSKERALSPSFGKQLLEIITAGMYSDPCMILREYVQNSADSIDLAVEKNLISFPESKIDIKLDGRNRTLIVEDNGMGVPNDELEKNLGGLGQSNKEGVGLRGFRGIGRLGGLSYCDALIFETKSKTDKSVGVVQWNGSTLRDSIATKGIKGLNEIISKIAKISYRKTTSQDPKHFFKVTLSNVNRFHTDRLTSLDAINEYLFRVAPLPFNEKNFTWGKKIGDFLKTIPGYRTHNIFVNGAKLFSPYSDEFQITGKKKDKISEVELIEFKTSKGVIFGKGWIAQTNFFGSLPKAITMRGISVRQGNLEIGNENFLEDYFSERRFASWHLGAFHLDYSLKPNARRDGFEETENYEKFLEQMTVLGKQMSKACRSASRERYNKQDLERSLTVIERFIRGGVYIDKEHFQSTYQKVSQLVSKLETRIGEKDFKHLEKKVVFLKKQILKKNNKIRFISELIDHRQLRHVQQTKLLENTCRAILRHIKHDGLSKKLLSDVLTPFVKAKRSSRVISLLN